MSILVARVFMRFCVSCELSISSDVGRRALRRTTPRRCRRRNAATITHNPLFIFLFISTFTDDTLPEVRVISQSSSIRLAAREHQIQAVELSAVDILKLQETFDQTSLGCILVLQRQKKQQYQLRQPVPLDARAVAATESESDTSSSSGSEIIPASIRCRCEGVLVSIWSRCEDTIHHASIWPETRNVNFTSPFQKSEGI